MQQNKSSLMDAHTYIHNQPLALESGKSLQHLEIQYQTAGKLNKEKNNVIWVCHALTGNADVFEWWEGLFGEDEVFNSKEHFIVCANVIGSCYGSSSPLHPKNIETGQGFHDFPQLTIRDMVKAHEVLRTHLGIEKINTLIGGSMGAYQAIEWAVGQTDLFQHTIFVAAGAQISPWGIAFNESQRMAIEADQTWSEQTVTAGEQGMKTARSIALLSYRHYNAYQQTQSEISTNKIDKFKAASYQNYQGEKLASRFNAFSYYRLTQAMDSHNVGRNRLNLQHALQRIKSRTLVVGIDSDLLFPTREQRVLAAGIEGAAYAEIASDYGHDGFLVETEKLSRVVRDFLASATQQQNGEMAPSPISVSSFLKVDK